MKLSNNLAIAAAILSTAYQTTSAQDEDGSMVKMCLFYENPSGHARTDPILANTCASDHVHTFYGPQNFHPQTTNDDLRNTAPNFSSSPWIENQSLYWHPSIYQVSTSTDGQKTHTRVDNLHSSPYYRWDNSVEPKTEAFPQNFRMIAFSDQEGANRQGDIGGSLLVECCDLFGEEEETCTTTMNVFEFPKKRCDFLGIGFAMPTCWDDSKGVGLEDPTGHVAYTTTGAVNGPCPEGYNRRIPQIQLFTRIIGYRGDIYDYVLSDESNRYHVDFMNGWQPGSLENVLEKCTPGGGVDSDRLRRLNPSNDQILNYNPACDCTQFLSQNASPSLAVCDQDVRQTILDEEITVVAGALPRGSCSGAEVIPKAWEMDPPFATNGCGGGNNNDNNNNDNNDNDNDNDEDNNNDNDNDNDNDEDNNNDNDNDNDNDEDNNNDNDNDENEDNDNENDNDNDNDNDEEEDEDNVNDNDNDNDEDEDNDNEVTCEDDATFLFRGKASKNCNWIKKKKKFCSKMSNGTKVSASCPVACNACPGDNDNNNDEDNDSGCQNDATFLFKGKSGKTCDWVQKKAKKKPAFCNKKSNGTKVKVACPVACNAC